MTAIEHILDLAELPASDIPDSARSMARFSLFDWMVCGQAGVGEPLAKILRSVIADEGGRPVASVFGGDAAPARSAALVNGATSHALDYDDTHFAHVGHLSVGVYPAALAAGEQVGAAAAGVVDAFLSGAEAAVRIGMVLGRAHYNRGFHQTATAGAVGATVAAGRLFGLSRAQMRAALGLCATRASGLKSQFGTMGKPYNAGISASNGVECAMLAGAGMTSADDGLEGPQGLVATHSDAPEAEAAWAVPVSERFLFEDVKYKLHACCHGTHAMIEGLSAAARGGGLSPEDVRAVRLRTNPRWLSVCDIKAPRTGLEVKFSFVWIAGMVLAGMPTSSDRTFVDALAGDAALEAFARRVTVEPDAALTDMQAEGEIERFDGSVIPFSHDLAEPLPPDVLARSLLAKAAAVLGEAGAGLWQAVEDLDGLSARELGARLRAP